MDWPAAPPTKDELPDGEYVVSYRGAVRRRWFGQEKVELIFEVVDPAAARGMRVSLFATLPERGRVSQRSKFFNLWTMANSGPPRRGSRMAPDVFQGYWKVRVRWTQSKDGGSGMPTITELIGREAGGRRH